MKLTKEEKKMKKEAKRASMMKDYMKIRNNTEGLKPVSTDEALWELVAIGVIAVAVVGIAIILAVKIF